MASGPTSREPCCVAWFKASAFSRCSLGTRFGIRACAVVIWPARRVPLNSANTINAQGPARSFITRKPSSMLWARLRAKIHRSMVWRSNRSAR